MAFVVGVAVENGKNRTLRLSVHPYGLPRAGHSTSMRAETDQPSRIRRGVQAKNSAPF